MIKIKTKDFQKKQIKRFDKTSYIISKLRKDSNSVYQDYSKENDENNTNAYGEEFIKDNTSNVSKTIKSKVSFKGRKNIPSKHGVIKTVNNPINEGKIVVNNTKQAYQRGKKLAIESKKKTIKIGKRLYYLISKMVKSVIKGIKSLIFLIITIGSFSFVIILVVAIIALFCSSIYGIFLSSEKLSPDSITMSSCIMELNNEMDEKIKEIENNNEYDEVIISSNKADWKDILSLYVARISNGDNSVDVLTINDEKKNILKEIFWDINSITSNIVVEKYDESLSIGTWDRDDITEIDDNVIEDKNILHININGKSSSDMMALYNFNDLQKNQYNELKSDKYLSLWNSAIYGVYSSTGEFTTWKQKDPKWASVKIGNTDKTLGRIGCLVTSVSMLIKKSNVPTKDIYPFNPATFVIALNNNYGFDKSGNLKYSAIKKAVPNFEYQGHINLRNKNKSEKLYEIKKYIENGYYLAVEVKGATKNSQHWVAIDNVVNNKILMLDPASDETDMWKKYDWNNTTQFVYFKVLV